MTRYSYGLKLFDGRYLHGDGADIDEACQNAGVKRDDVRRFIATSVVNEKPAMADATKAGLAELHKSPEWKEKRRVKRRVRQAEREAIRALANSRRKRGRGVKLS